jgi:hypothetical protein
MWDFEARKDNCLCLPVEGYLATLIVVGHDSSQIWYKLELSRCRWDKKVVLSKVPPNVPWMMSKWPEALDLD